LIAFSGCRKQDSNSSNGPESGKTLDQLVIASNFNWATTRDVTISISAKDNLDNPVPGVRFTLYTANPDSGGIYLVSGITGTDGLWNSVASLPSSMNSVTVFNNFLGLIRQMELPITSNSITGQFDGKPAATVVNKSLEGGEVIKTSSTTKWVYMSTYNYQGVPDNILPVNEPVSQQLMTDINAALPAYKNEVAYHPEWFASTVPNNLDILSNSCRTSC